MYFYVDESGHTGAELFDAAQPTLYYGVISSDVNLDVLAEERLRPLRKRFEVDRLHAAQLGVGRLASISDELMLLQKAFKLRFDFYRVQKPDHAIISFFDQVFDQAMNKAVPWTSYWTPLRYVLMLKLATLFDEEDARLAWSARIDVNDASANAKLAEVCTRLAEKVSELPDVRSREVIGGALRWAAHNPGDIGYNVSHKDDIKQISPNIIGFQSVMHGIARRITKRDKRASRIVVDRQSQFNKAQKTLAEFFAMAAKIPNMDRNMPPGMPKVSFAGMPDTPIEFVAGTDSAGLELVDLYLWIFKRVHEGKDVAPELLPLLGIQGASGDTDEISLEGIERRWTPYFKAQGKLEDLPAEQIAAAREILALQETRRQMALQGLPSPDTTG